MMMRARLLIAATLLVAAAWLIGGGWRFDRDAMWRTLVVGLIVPIVVIFGSVALMLWAGRQSTLRPVFDVRTGAFVAPPAPLQVAARTSALLAMMLFVVGSQLRTFAEDDPWLTALAVVVLVTATVAILLSTPWVLALFRDRPRIELRPDGLRLLDGAASFAVPWEAIAVGPVPRVNSWTTVHKIKVVRPGLMRLRGLARLWRWGRTVPLPTQLATHPAFVADAVNHYLFHPQHRPAIGTPGEYERLRQALHAR